MLRRIAKFIWQICRPVIDIVTPCVVIALIAWQSIQWGLMMSTHNELHPAFNMFGSAALMLSFVVNRAFLRQVVVRLLQTLFLTMVVSFMLAVALNNPATVYTTGSLAGILAGLAVWLTFPIGLGTVFSFVIKPSESTSKQKREETLHHAVQTLSDADTAGTHPAARQIHSQPRQQQTGQ
jgi:hypothetical protein